MTDIFASPWLNIKIFMLGYHKARMIENAKGGTTLGGVSLCGVLFNVIILYSSRILCFPHI